MAVTYDILPNGAGWRVHSRGFTWDFDQGPQAVEFANDMAEHYSRNCRQPTSVRFSDDGGADFHELRAFEVETSWGAVTHPDVRHATVVPFRRKAL